MKALVLKGFLLGVAVSLLVLLVTWTIVEPLHLSTIRKDIFEKVSLILWPTSFWLMAATGLDFGSMLVLLLAILANGIMYAILALLGRTVKIFWGRSLAAAPGSYKILPDTSGALLRVCVAAV